MVVNPQTFHYRLIIGALIVTIIGLTTYSLSSYNELKEQKEFVAQEKKIVESELSKIVSRYDVLITENEDFKVELDSAKQKTIHLLNTLKYQEASLFMLSEYRKQIQELQDQKGKFIKLTQTLQQKNSQLQIEKRAVTTKLDKQEEYNTELSEKNLLLAENLKKGSTLTANSFKARAYKTKVSGKTIETNKAKRTDVIEACFTLSENALVESGKKKYTFKYSTRIEILLAISFLKNSVTLR